MKTYGIGLIVLILTNVFLFWKLEKRFVLAWRKTVLEDLTADRPIDFSESRRFSIRNLYLPFYADLLLVFLGLAGLIGATWYIGQAGVFDFAVIRVSVVVLFSLFMIVSFIEYYRQGMKLASEAGLANDPPASFDVLIQTAPRQDMLNFSLGLPRNPTAWLKSGSYSETIIMGALIIFSSLSPINVALRQANPWPVYVIVTVSCLAFLVFMKIVAGKPNIRHRGWMATCVFFMVFYGWMDGVVLHDAIAKYPAAKNQTMYLTIFLGYFGFCFYALVAFLAHVSKRAEPEALAGD